MNSENPRALRRILKIREPLEVYLQNLKLCKVCETFQLLRQKVLKPSKSAVFPRDAQKNTFSKSAKTRRGRKCTKRIDTYYSQTDQKIRIIIILFSVYLPLEEAEKCTKRIDLYYSQTDQNIRIVIILFSVYLPSEEAEKGTKRIDPYYSQADQNIMIVIILFSVYLPSEGAENVPKE